MAKKRSAADRSDRDAQPSRTGSGRASRARRKLSVCRMIARARAVFGPTSNPGCASGYVTTRTSACSSVAAAWKRSIDASRPASTTSIGGIEPPKRRK